MTKRIIKYSLSIVFLSMCLTLMPIGVDLQTANQVKAAGWWDTVSEGGLDDVGQAYGQTGTPTEDYDIRVMVARLIRVVLELLGVIFLILIIVAGVRWMMAGGDEEKVTTAKKQLTNSVIGLVIIVAAWSISIFVFNQLHYATTGVMPVTW